MIKKLQISDGSATGDREDEQSLAKLLTLAGPRVKISPDIERRVHARVYNEWFRASRVTRHLRWAVPFALAATLLVAIAIGIWTPDLPAKPIGSVARVVGNSPSNAAILTTGETIYAGDSFRTGSRGISFQLSNGVSIRLNEHSDILFDDADEVTLRSGMLYADTGQPIYRTRHIVVHTPAATTTDLGTQFMIAYRGEQMSVAVREGAVNVASSDSHYTAMAGEKLTVLPGDEVRMEEVPTSHESWDWAEALAPDYDIENRSLLDFLKWFSRETGRDLYFTSNDVRTSAMRTKLHGSISDMTPLEAAHSVLSTTGFQYRIDRESIQIDK